MHLTPFYFYLIGVRVEMTSHASSAVSIYRNSSIHSSRSSFLTFVYKFIPGSDSKQDSFRRGFSAQSSKLLGCQKFLLEYPQHAGNLQKDMAPVASVNE